MAHSIYQMNMFRHLGEKPRHTIPSLVMEFFKNHPNEEFPHDPIVDWVTERWIEEHGTAPRDPWRAIRQLHQDGELIKVRKGIYKYDPDLVQRITLWDFPKHVRSKILARDNYRCVICGRGRDEGVELVVDHIKPRDKGGTNDMENGQTLCMEHNLLKKNYTQTEAGKRYFIKIYQKALLNQDTKMMHFCQAIFQVYDEFGLDKHIPRPDIEA